MSIDNWITELERCGELHALQPVLPGDPVVRRIWLSAEVQALIEGPWPNAKWEIRCGKLRADLEAFVIGHEIGVCLTPYQAGTAYMALLSPVKDGIWDIRSRDPQPGLRILGAFAMQDGFVALVPASRSVGTDLPIRGPLGDRNSAAWKAAVRDCKAKWRRLFPMFQRIGGDNIHDYLDDKFHLV